MTATINASTSAGVVVTSDTSGSLALQTANTTAMTINSSQVVNFANAPTIAGGALPIASGGTGLTSVGTNGQVLTSNGTSLSYTTPSSGAMIEISSQTGSSVSNILFTSGISSTYTKYRIIIENFWDTGNTSFSPGMRFYSGSTIDTNAAYGSSYLVSNAGTPAIRGGSSVSGIQLATNNTTGGAINSAYYTVIDFTSINNISPSWQIYGTFQTCGSSSSSASPNTGAFSFAGQSGNGGPVLGFNIYEYSGGTGAFNAKVTLYGIQS